MQDIIDQIKMETQWQKKAELVKTFHDKHVTESGKKRGERWTLQDTACALSLSIGYISEALTLAGREEVYGLSRTIALQVLRSKFNGNN